MVLDFCLTLLYQKFFLSCRIVYLLSFFGLNHQFLFVTYFYLLCVFVYFFYFILCVFFFLSLRLILISFIIFKKPVWMLFFTFLFDVFFF